VIKVAAMKNTEDFCLQKEAIMCCHKIYTFVVSKDEDEWSTEEEQQYAKRRLSGLSNI